MNLFVYIAVYFAIGLSLKKVLTKPQQVVSGLNTFIIHLAYPAVILTVVSAMNVTIDIAIPTLSYWLLIPVAACLVSVLARCFKWPKATSFVVFILCICGNTGFLGVPLVKAFLPAESVGFALIYDQFGTFLGLSTLVIFLLAQYENTGSRFDWVALFRKLLLFTPFTVLILSLLLPMEALVNPLREVLLFLGNLIVPAAMIGIGIQFRFKIARQWYAPLSSLLVLKLVVLPGLLWICLWVLDTPHEIVSPIVFQAAAAPMITAAALLMSARIAPPLVASALGLGTLLSLAILPLWGSVLSSQIG